MSYLIRLVVITFHALVLSACVGKASFEGDANTLNQSQVQTPLLLVSEPEPLSIIVIGGTSGVGLECVKLALDRGHHVTAVSRKPQKLTLQHPQLTKAAGNILSESDMTKLMAGHDIIISTVGLAAGKRNVTLFSKGTLNLLKVMQYTNQTRLISVSAIGAGDSKGHGGFLFDAILQPLVLGDDIDDKTRMEQLLINSDIDFTIVRPAILSNDVASRDYRIFTELTGVETGSISRKDVAHFIVSVAEQDAYIRQVVTLSN